MSITSNIKTNSNRGGSPFIQLKTHELSRIDERSSRKNYLDSNQSSFNFSQREGFGQQQQQYSQQENMQIVWEHQSKRAIFNWSKLFGK